MRGLVRLASGRSVRMVRLRKGDRVGHDQDGRVSDFRSRSLRRGLSRPSIDRSPALSVVISFVHSLYFRRNYPVSHISAQRTPLDILVKRHAPCLQSPQIEPYIQPRLIVSLHQELLMIHHLPPPKNQPPKPRAFDIRLGRILSFATLAKYLSACDLERGASRVPGSGPVYTRSGCGCGRLGREGPASGSIGGSDMSYALSKIAAQKSRFYNSVFSALGVTNILQDTSAPNFRRVPERSTIIVRKSSVSATHTSVYTSTWYYVETTNPSDS
jgi:hypothetical protein